MLRHFHTTNFWPCAAFCFVLGLHEFAAFAQTSAPPQAAVVNLFYGKSLAGWEGDPAHWRIEDATILGEIAQGQSLNKNTWLVWRAGELADFELNVKFKLTGLPAANSGIQIRCQVDNVDHVSGYQADLYMGATWLGRIYD